jgi:acyl-CoA synthetase (AMP-forming)/AMP-acid ligase II
MALETFDEVAHALVYGIPHPEFDEEVTAVIVPAVKTGFDLERVLTRLRARVSSYKVPTRVHILDDEAKIPWLASGKPDKSKLKAQLEEP